MSVPNAESYMAISLEHTQQTGRPHYNHRHDVLLPLLARTATFPLHLAARTSMALHG